MPQTDHARRTVMTRSGFSFGTLLSFGLVWPHLVLTVPKPVLSPEQMTTETSHALLAKGVGPRQPLLRLSGPGGELGAPGVGRE